VNDVYSVASREGRFALRVSHVNWRSPAALLAELRALQHLNACCNGVAKPVHRADGGCITDIWAPEGLRHAVLFHWVGGRAPCYTDASQAAQFGRHLAMLHTAADTLAPNAARPRIDAQCLLYSPVELIRPRMRQIPVAAARLEALAERLRARLDGAQQELRDWGFCHGDMHAGNTRIDADRMVSFDFDACGAGWRIYDLASYKWHARLHGVEQVAWAPFVDGYLEMRPQIASSLGHIGLFTILRHLWITGQLIVFSSVMGRGLLSEDFFESLVPFCERIESESPEGYCAFPNAWPGYVPQHVTKSMHPPAAPK